MEKKTSLPMSREGSECSRERRQGQESAQVPFIQAAEGLCLLEPEGIYFPC